MKRFNFLTIVALILFSMSSQAASVDIQCVDENKQTVKVNISFLKAKVFVGELSYPECQRNIIPAMPPRTDGQVELEVRCVENMGRTWSNVHLTISNEGRVMRGAYLYSDQKGWIYEGSRGGMIQLESCEQSNPL